LVLVRLLGTAYGRLPFGFVRSVPAVIEHEGESVLEGSAERQAAHARAEGLSVDSARSSA